MTAISSAHRLMNLGMPWQLAGYITGAAGGGQGISIQFGSGEFPYLPVTTGITAGTTRTQAGAVALTQAINRVDTSTAATAGTLLGDGVALPVSAAGLQVTVINNTANPIQCYGNGSDTTNGVAATSGVLLAPGSVTDFYCAAAGAWVALAGSGVAASYGANTATAGTTLTAANVVGGTASVDLAMTGTLGAGANAQLPTVAGLVGAMYVPAAGSSYRLRVTNLSSANFAWTVTTNTGWTLTGTMSIAQNTWREFVVTLTSLTAATLQSVATGTIS